MPQLSIDNILTIVFGIISVVMTAIALRYTIKEHKRKAEEMIDGGRQTAIFLTREAMLKYLLAMYDKAEKGDCIWGQCVGCANYSDEVRSKILSAAGKGVGYRMIVNKYASSLDAFRTLYEPISNAELVYGEDNALRIQGLSDKEIVVAFPGVDSYTAVLFRDSYFIKILKQWFDTRFEDNKRLIKGQDRNQGG